MTKIPIFKIRKVHDGGESLMRDLNIPLIDLSNSPGVKKIFYYIDHDNNILAIKNYHSTGASSIHRWNRFRNCWELIGSRL